MKNRVIGSSVLLVCLAAAALPACAGTVYDNGPTNGQTDAWTINFGFIVSNQFSCCREAAPDAGGTVTGLQFAAWLSPGDVLQSVEVSITSAEFGGTTYFDQVVPFTQSDCFSNQYGYSVCLESGNFAPVNLAAGDYWLNLQNADVNTGDPVYWDENSGPSRASQNSLGTIPSESFTLLGETTQGTVPEPGSCLLLTSGAAVLVGIVRRRLNR